MYNMLQIHGKPRYITRIIALALHIMCKSTVPLGVHPLRIVRWRLDHLQLPSPQSPNAATSSIKSKTICAGVMPRLLSSTSEWG